MNVILRRRNLGRTSCREISRFSEEPIRVVRNDRVGAPDAGTLFRWGCTSDIGEVGTVVNTAKAIHEVNNKKDFRMLLQNDGTDLVPETFTEESITMWNPHYPVVLRPGTHSRGRNIYVVNTHIELLDTVRRRNIHNWYASRLVYKAAEYRVAVAQGRVVWVERKTPGNPEDVAWNVARGGRFDNVNWDAWPLQAVRKSVEAFNISSLDFGGVDVMVDQEGKAYIIEINSAPSLTSPYRQECFAKVFD